MLLSLFIFFLALIILIKGADLFVESSRQLARAVGVSDFIIGLTLVAVGTSLPELATGILSSLAHASPVAAGTVIGSNITNIGFILGLSSVLATFSLKKTFYRRDTFFLLAISVLFYFFAVDALISTAEGVLLFGIFLAYLVSLGRATKQERDDVKRVAAGMSHQKQPVLGIVPHLGVAFFGLLALFVGAHFLVSSTLDIASAFHLPEEVIAITAIAFGTSLPELSVSLVALKRNLGSMLVGNLVGSNITNLLLVGGVSAFIEPMTLSRFDLVFALPLMILFVFVFLRYLSAHWFSRILHGILLLLLYAGFLLALVLANLP